MDHEPAQAETTSRHETSSPASEVSRVDAQTLVVRDGAAASEGDQGTRAQPTTAGRTAAGAGSDPEATPLFAEQEATQFRDRWDEVQAGFVDEPRRAVEQADGLVAEVMQRLAASFSDERSRLEASWGRGEETETEGLRLALRKYRSFFDRLLRV
ncbi:MAG TPA: hypothetical protein VIR57_01015 [Chloroflexota bacterium]